MKILAHTGGIASTNCYLVVDDVSGDCVLFDAPDHTVEPLLDHVTRNGFNLIGLWLTHGHFDHLADHKVVSDRFPDARILIHALDEPKLLRPGSRLFQLPFEIPPGKPDELVADGQALKLGTLDVKVLHTPGHSPGHVCYHFPSEGVLIGGDLIIGGSVGRTDLPDSNFDDLQASVRKVMALPGSTKLLPGHADAGTLDDERAINPIVARILARG